MALRLVPAIATLLLALKNEACLDRMLSLATIMSDRPSSPSPALVSLVRSLILEFFDLTDQEAHGRAFELAALAEGWGEPETAKELDWSAIVRKQLGATERWRSEAMRQRFLKNRQEVIKAYQAYISNQKRKPDRLPL